MRISEIRPCSLCNQGLCKHGHLSFFRVTLQRFGLDRRAVQEAAVIELLFEGRARPDLVEAFSSRPEIAYLLDEPADLMVCEHCAAGMGVDDRTIHELFARAHRELKERKLVPPKET